MSTLGKAERRYAPLIRYYASGSLPRARRPDGRLKDQALWRAVRRFHNANVKNWREDDRGKSVQARQRAAYQKWLREQIYGPAA